MNEMDTNTMETTEVKSAFGALAARVKRNNNGKLPRIEYFRVDIDKGVGTAATWHAGYILQVKVRGVDGMYCAGTVGAAYGMNVKYKFASAEKAREAGMKIKKEWGRVSQKAERRAAKSPERIVAGLNDEQKRQLRAILEAELNAA